MPFLVSWKRYHINIFILLFALNMAFFALNKLFLALKEWFFCFLVGNLYPNKYV